ncbi:uncharacterized protein [Asterias amurensis]|uniref:uncharacterized protein n=1 Tax=Asterias amurensis TaxID=7602 RepID=UPI003AB55148
MGKNRRAKATFRSPMYPVGGYTKRIDQYSAVPPSVLAEERRLQNVEKRIEKGRRCQLAQCEKKQREAAKHLKELSEAKEKVSILPMKHTEYLYGGCVTVRVLTTDDRCKDEDEESYSPQAKDSRRGGSFHPKNPPRNSNHEKHSRPPGRACHRTHATTKLPELLVKPRLPKRRQPRSWASLKKQFQEKVLPGGEFPRVSTGTPLETVDCYGLEGSNSSDTAGVDGSKARGGEFVSEMKRCRYIRVPERYNGIQDEER